MHDVEVIAQADVTSIRILCLDPGESTGWVLGEADRAIRGGTCRRNHLEVAQLILDEKPDIIVLERFNLYPGMAKSLAWNSFYPCEVIGVIKYVAMTMNIPIVEQAPSVKKYAGEIKDRADWLFVKDRCAGVTEHTKDAYQHYRYFQIHGLKKLPKA